MGSVDRRGNALAGMVVEREKDVTVLRPWGALDLVGVDAIRSQIDEATAEPARVYCLDLANVSFLDGSGVREIVRAWEAVRQRGGRMSVVNEKPQIRRLLQLTGCLRHLESLPGAS